MNNLTFFQLNFLVKESIEQIILLEEKQCIISLVWTKLLVKTRLDEALLLFIFIHFVLVKVIVKLSNYLVLKVARDNKRLLNSYRDKQAPCKNCQFLTNNRYLMCAVHPTTVLTKQAINCSDYLFHEHLDSSVPAKIVVSATVFDPQTQSWYYLSNLYKDSESVRSVAPFLGHSEATPLMPED